MKDEDLDQRLADYVAGEMSAEQRRQFEDLLNRDAVLREDAESLQRTLGALTALPDVGEEEATVRAGAVEVRRRPGPGQRWLLGGFKYAAVLLVGLGIGSHLDTLSDRAMPPPPVTDTTPSPRLDVHPDWVQEAARVGRRYPGNASFFGQLRILSAARRQG